MKRLVFLALSAVLALAQSAAAQQCPKACPKTFSVVASGGFVSPDIVTLTPLNTLDGTGALLGVIGGGVHCSTCTQCSAEFLLSWDITNDKCFAYNNCGLLQSGPGSGEIQYTLYRNCGSSINLRLDYGDCNPLYTGSCPPVAVLPADYTATWTLACATCQ